MRPAALMVVVAAALLPLGACGGLRGEQSLVSESGTAYGADEVAGVAVSLSPTTTIPNSDVADVADVVPVAAERAVPMAFAFESTDITGTDIDGADLFGSAPVLMTFLRADCEISAEEAPKLLAAAQRHGDITFVLVRSGPLLDWDDDWFQAAAEVSNILVLDDSDDQLWRRFAVEASPSSVLVDQEGLMRSSFGALGESGLDRAVVALTAGFA